MDESSACTPSTGRPAFLKAELSSEAILVTPLDGRLGISGVYPATEIVARGQRAGQRLQTDTRGFTSLSLMDRFAAEPELDSGGFQDMSE